MNNYYDYISFHGKISSIRDTYDKNYIWFDIVQYELLEDEDGRQKINPFFFSAKIPKESSQRYDLNINIDVLVRGIPKGYVDKKGYRQNYIQVNEINDIKIDKIIEEKYHVDEDGNEYWNGKIIPETEPWDITERII